MKLHELKIKPEYYDEVFWGHKTFEIRKDDRDYKVGDLINFKVETKEGEYATTEKVYAITYILRNCPQYGLMDGYCILGIRKLEETR